MQILAWYYRPGRTVILTKGSDTFMRLRSIFHLTHVLECFLPLLDLLVVHLITEHSCAISLRLDCHVLSLNMSTYPRYLLLGLPTTMSLWRPPVSFMNWLRPSCEAPPRSSQVIGRSSVRIQTCNFAASLPLGRAGTALFGSQKTSSACGTSRCRVLSDCRALLLYSI